MMKDLARPAVGAALLGASLAPCLISALRAARIRPMVALKND